MRIDQIDLRIVRLPLVRPFQTSSSRKEHLDHILVRVVAGGVTGWGECASPSDPYYCPETTETCWHILKDFLAPLGAGARVVDHRRAGAASIGWSRGTVSPRRGWRWPAGTRWPARRGSRCTSLLGGTPAEILSGVSLGIESRDRAAPRPDRPLPRGRLPPDQAQDRAGLGCRRRAAGPRALSRRSRFRSTPTRPTRSTTCPTLKALDDFDLLLIEQPLAHDDIIDHARLQAALKTPICLDESIHSADDARKALDLGACRVINIKVSRVGGLLEAKRVHDLCHARGVPVWCGGMHEFGIGRAANVAIASLPGFTLPGDVSGSDKYYAEDIVEPPILATMGRSRCSTGPGWASSRSRSGSKPGRSARSYAQDMKDRVMIPHDLLEMFRSYQRMILDDLEELVRLESPSRDKPALDALEAVLTDRLRMLRSLRSTSIANAHGGDHVLGRFAGPAERARLWFSATSIRSGRAGRSSGCRSASTTAGRSGPASST